VIRPPLSATGLCHRGREHVKKLDLLRCLRLRGTVRRHVPRIQLVEHPLPAVGSLDGVDRERDVIQTHAPLGLVSIVALETILRDKGLVPPIHDGVTRGRGRRGDGPAH
jgi:hypothetical protein